MHEGARTMNPGAASHRCPRAGPPRSRTFPADRLHPIVQRITGRRLSLQDQDGTKPQMTNYSNTVSFANWIG